MKYLLFIALGGASGAVARYVVATWVHELWEGHVPVGTLLVNLVGSFAIGVVFVLIVEKQIIHQDWRSVLMVGFLGAFTTFATFSLETVTLIESGALAARPGLHVNERCLLRSGSRFRYLPHSNIYITQLVT